MRTTACRGTTSISRPRRDSLRLTIISPCCNGHSRAGLLRDAPCVHGSSTFSSSDIQRLFSAKASSRWPSSLSVRRPLTPLDVAGIISATTGRVKQRGCVAPGGLAVSRKRGIWSVDQSRLIWCDALRQIYRLFGAISDHPIPLIRPSFAMPI